MRRRWAFLCAATLVAAMTIGAAGPAHAQPGDQRARRYIVVLDDDVDSTAVAADHARRHDARVGHVYRHALKGYAAVMSPAAAERVAGDSRVAYVEPDGVATIAHHRNGHDGGPGADDGGTTEPPAQTLPTGVDRVDADRNATARIDGVDERVDVDIAIIDTGMDEDHPDLNIAGGWNCVSLFSPGTCFEGMYEDGHGHGTHVAGTAAALDNGYGVVGVAPGARLWAVAVLDDNGSGYWSWIIGGIDKVTENAATIEVANMSLGGTGDNQALRDAITGAVNAGVVFTVAAGNSGKDVYGSDGVLGGGDDFIPAAYPEVATVSALADSDGMAGGLGGGTSYGSDDSFASFSNFSASVASPNPVTSPGAAIDLLMPGVSIYSTDRYGGYRSMSGTSMASPHAAGLAGLSMVENNVNPGSAAGVATIRQALIDSGQDQTSDLRLEYPDTEPDAKPENLGWAGGSTTSEPSSVDAVDDSYSTDEDTPLSVPVPGVLGNDVDGDGQGSLSASLASGAGKGTVSLNADGSFTYTPDTNVNGTDTFTYQLSESDGPDTDTATVTITIAALNDAPVANDDNASTTVGTAKTVDVLGNDTDVDADALSVTNLTQPGSGSVTLNTADQTVTYSPPTGWTGTTSFSYTANDGNVDSNTAIVTVTVAEAASLTLDLGYATEGGRFNDQHLLVTVAATHGGSPAASASVSIDLHLNGVFYASGSGTTGSDGRVTFKVTNAPAGTYTTDVTQVVLSDNTTFTDPDETDPGFTKS